jgi:hypothetical protein
VRWHPVCDEFNFRDEKASIPDRLRHVGGLKTTHIAWPYGHSGETCFLGWGKAVK